MVDAWVVGCGHKKISVAVGIPTVAMSIYVAGVPVVTGRGTADYGRPYCTVSAVRQHALRLHSQLSIRS